MFFSNDILRPGCAAGQPGSVGKVMVKMKQSMLQQEAPRSGGELFAMILLDFQALCLAG